MKGVAFPLRSCRLVRLLLGLTLVIGWLVIDSYRPSLAGPRLQGNGQTYIVQSGDSLVRISASFYGDATQWPEIFAATNAKAQDDTSFAFIDNPRLIFPGQKLWIPELPIAEQPATPTQQPAEPTQAPIVSSTSTPLAPVQNGGAPVQTNELAASLRQLLQDGGALAGAQNQTALAREHLGFLQAELDAENLAEARRHAEHLVNILEGEEGVLFGDNDRDGQTQNPGDGMGVGSYLTDVQTVLDMLDEVSLAGEGGTAIQQLRNATAESQGLVQPAAEKAFQVFAADSVDETSAIAVELEALLNELFESITSMVVTGSQLLATPTAFPVAENVTLLPLRELFTEDGGALAGAQNQTALAREHLGFLQAELDAENLAEAQRHAEHLVNILEGEEGVLFGDNDRDGQTQNPGDGVGVGSYLADAQAQAQAVLDALDQVTTGGNVDMAVQQLITATVDSQGLVQPTAEKAFQVFAADSVGETQTIAAELAVLLNQLQEAINITFTAGDQLFSQ